MKKIAYIFILLLTSIQISAASSEKEDIALIKSRYSDFYASTAPKESMIKQYLDSLDLKSGGWCDIDYASTIGSDWRTKEHTRRAMWMAQFYAKGESHKTTLFTRKELSEAIHSAWGYWFRERPYCTTNWYPNKLSCPHELGISFMLMQDEMSAEESENAVKLVYKKSQLAKSGSNLIYVANTALMQGIFQKDPALIRKAIDAISSTIFIAGKGVEGIQSDYSYHLHGAQQQMGNYGREAINILAPFCSVLKGTSFDFSIEQKDILSNLITQGFRWHLWRGYLDMIGSGRQYGADMFKFKCDNILVSSQRISHAATPQQKAEIAAMIKENSGKCQNTLVGQKFFDKSDCFIHRRKDWAASLKMHSTRVRGTEMSKNDNRRGFYSPDGALYIYVDGGEYENVTALWDWCKVPGITCYDSGDDSIVQIKPNSGRYKNLANRSDFVGACSDGTQGVAAMILNKDGQIYRKSWIFTPEFVLCMGSDLIENSGELSLTTSVEQRFLEGELAVLQGGKWLGVEDKRAFREEGLRLHHHKTGYIILDDNECVASVEARSGNWNDVTFGVDPLDVSGKMASIFIRHKRQPGDYKYLILPNRSRREIAKFDTKKVEILANSKDVQLVYNAGVYYVTAYSAGRYKMGGKYSIEVEQAGIFMLKREQGSWSIIAHDPTKQISNSEMESKIKVVEK